jgi:hypothetical protein
MQYTSEQLDAIFKKGNEYKIQQKKPEWMAVLNELNKRDRCENILEIGCYDGGCSVTLSYFTKNLWSVDVHNPCLFDTRLFDVRCNFKYVIGDSQREDTISKLKVDIKELDLLFIDGDHSEKGSRNDYNNYSPLVKDGGLIVFHDIADSPNHHMLQCYVANTWNAVKNNHKGYIEACCDNNLKELPMEEFNKSDLAWGGVGIIHK